MIFAILLAIIAATLFIISYFAMRYACRRGRELDCNIDAEIEKSIFRVHKDLIIAGREWLKAHPHETVCTTSFDHLRLSARYVPCENARGTLLLFHGYRSSPFVDFGCAFSVYHELGLNLLLVDQRAHGASEGRYITYGVRERRDVRSWVDWHNARFGTQMPVLLGGMSMGATTVLMSCGEDLPENVRGVIADCGFTSPYEILRKVISKDTRFPAALILPLMDLQMRLFAGFYLHEYSTIDAMQRTKLPVFFVHGQADTFVPCDMTQKNYDACIHPAKRILLVPDAGHGQSYLRQPVQYRQMLDTFLEEIF